MKTFRNFLRSADEKRIIIIFESDDTVAARNADFILVEAKTYQIDARYSARFDKGHQPNQQDHTHVYMKKNEVCVVNKDGTPSHGSKPLSSLPQYIQKEIRNLRLVESRLMFEESASGQSSPVVPTEVMQILRNLLSLGRKRGDG